MLQTFDVLLSVHHRILIYAHSRGDKIYCLAAKYHDGSFTPLYPSRTVETNKTKIAGRLRILDDDAKQRVPREHWCIALEEVAWKAQEKEIDRANCYLEPL